MRGRGWEWGPLGGGGGGEERERNKEMCGPRAGFKKEKKWGRGGTEKGSVFLELSWN